MFPLAVFGDQIAELLESSVHHLDPRPEGCEPDPSGLDGIGVTVDPEQTDVGPGLEQERRMTAAADRAVDEQPGRHRQEELHHLPGHDREMRELRLHTRLLIRSSPDHRVPKPRPLRSRLQPPGRQLPPGMSPRVGDG